MFVRVPTDVYPRVSCQLIPKAREETPYFKSLTVPLLSLIFAVVSACPGVASARLRKEREISPSDCARVRISVWRGVSSSVAVLPVRDLFVPLLLQRLTDCKHGNIAKDSLADFIVLVADLDGAREDDIDAIVGKNKTASSSLLADGRRYGTMPAGRIAAMTPPSLILISFCSLIGSPAMKGARAIEPESFDGRPVPPSW